MALGLALGLPYILSNGWTPAALGASLLGFWDAERDDLITQSGGTVSSWRDAVAGYDAVQATGSLKPVYSATSFNNRPGLTFDGVDDYLELGSQPFPSGASPSEIWVLANQTALVADTTGRRAFSYGSGANDRRDLMRSVVATANRVAVAVGDGLTTNFTASPAVDLSGLHVMRAVISATASNAEADGTAGSALAVVPATAATRVRIGASASGASGASVWQGVQSVALVTAPLTTAQAAQLLTYLKARGGIA